MTAAFILVFSVQVLVQFAVRQWRMILLTTANMPLSDSLRITTGIDTESISAQDFGKVVGLCDEISPLLKKGTPWLREIKSYYGLMAGVEKVCRSIQPAMSAWAAVEMKTCSRYVAVLLDQNL